MKTNNFKLKKEIKREKNFIGGEMQEQFIEIPPYTKDPDNEDKWLNNTNEYILVKKDPINIQEYINSFKEETDLYSILERVAKGETGLLNKKQSLNINDISEIPNNINEQKEYLNKLENLSKEIEKLKAKVNNENKVESTENNKGE